MTYATTRPAAAPALDRLALAGVLAVALAAAVLLSSCVNAAVHDTSVKLHAQLQALHETSEPAMGATEKEVAIWQRAWAEAITRSAQLVEVSR